MTDQTIPLGELTGLEISAVSGDLHLTGWSREEIRIKKQTEDHQIEEKKGILQVSSHADLIIHLPHNLPVEITSVSGDANLRGISSELHINAISGDLNLRDVGSTSLDTVQGDLFASRVQGVLRGDTIRGDALIDDVQGQVELKKVSGDLLLDKVDGGIDVRASGNGRIDFFPVPWQAYRVEVLGDLSVTMPVDTNADLKIISKEENITLFPGKLDIVRQEKKLEHQLGEGGTSLQFTAAGKVFIVDSDFSVFTGIKMNLEDLGSLTTDFSVGTAEQIKENLGHLEEDLRESLSSLSASLEDVGLSEEYLRELGTQIEETSRQAAEKAEIAAIKAQAKVEKKIAKARRKALDARDKTKQFDLNKFLETRTEKDSVSEQERLLILKMLQEKKISPQEADSLLQALEGK